jgi:endoglycosylceramidase
MAGHIDSLRTSSLYLSLIVATLAALGSAGSAGCGGDRSAVGPDAVADVPADLPTADEAPDALPDTPSDAPSDTPSDIPEPPLYRTQAGRIVDRQGRTLILRGINVASGDLVNWASEFPEFEANVFRHIADSGFNAVRFVINWDRIEPEKDQIRTDYLETVQAQVRRAAAQGLYVFLDMHQDMYGIGFGNHGAPAWSCNQANYDAFEPQDIWFMTYFTAPVSACFDGFWKNHDLHAHQQEAARRVAETVADVDLVVGFDPVNEPFPGTIDFDTFDSDYLYPFYEEFAASVGTVLPGRLFFIEPAVTFSASQTCYMPGPITAFQGVFAPHYYNPGVEMQKVWDGDTGALSTAVQTAQDVATGLGMPLAFGEMGGARETSNLGDYLEAFFGELDARFAGSFLWIYSRGTSGFGMIESQTGGWTTHARAYLRPAPTAVGGVPTKYSWDVDQRVMILEWADDGRNGTEVMLPAWIRAAPFTCVLDNELVVPATNAAGNRLLIPAAPAGPRTFRLTATAPWPG